MQSIKLWLQNMNSNAVKEAYGCKIWIQMQSNKIIFAKYKLQCSQIKLWLQNMNSNAANKIIVAKYEI